MKKVLIIVVFFVLVIFLIFKSYTFYEYFMYGKSKSNYLYVLKNGNILINTINSYLINNNITDYRQIIGLTGYGFIYQDLIKNKEFDDNFLGKINLVKVNNNCFVFAFNINQNYRNNNGETKYLRYIAREKYDIPNIGCTNNEETNNCNVFITEKGIIYKSQKYECK